jgi:ribonuclease P protein component
MSGQNFFFPKSARLLATHQFRRVSKYGKTIGGAYLNLQVCTSRHPLLKLGLTVSRKFGNAVRRNRFKRLVREAFRLEQHKLPTHLLINVRPTPDSANATLEEIQNEFLTLLT